MARPLPSSKGVQRHEPQVGDASVDQWRLIRCAGDAVQELMHLDRQSGCGQCLEMHSLSTDRIARAVQGKQRSLPAK